MDQNNVSVLSYSNKDLLVPCIYYSILLQFIFVVNLFNTRIFNENIKLLHGCALLWRMLCLFLQKT